jgi:hypothetical protein
MSKRPTLYAAVAICGGPLIDERTLGAELVAHVAPMDRPVDLRLFLSVAFHLIHSLSFYGRKVLRL